MSSRRRGKRRPQGHRGGLRASARKVLARQKDICRQHYNVLVSAGLDDFYTVVAATCRALPLEWLRSDGTTAAVRERRAYLEVTRFPAMGFGRLTDAGQAPRPSKAIPVERVPLQCFSHELFPHCSVYLYVEKGQEGRARQKVLDFFDELIPLRQTAMRVAARSRLDLHREFGPCSPSGTKSKVG